jgi:hypothetical protein
MCHNYSTKHQVFYELWDYSHIGASIFHLKIRLGPTSYRPVSIFLFHAGKYCRILKLDTILQMARCNVVERNVHASVCVMRILKSYNDIS